VSSEPESRYDRIADAYAPGPDDLTVPATVSLLELSGDVGGRRVLDVACGHGLLARALASRGAGVVGVDVSARLLDRARAAEAALPMGIEYVLADIASPDALAGERFDAGVCNFGLSDIDALDGACASVARLLVGGGWFVFSILHPCFPGVEDVSGSWPTGGGYYDEGWWRADGALSLLRREVGANHRTLSTYVNTLAAHGLVIERLAEPPPGETWSSGRPGAERLPVYLVARCRRMDGGLR
jgi:SAM-dependent methyltransferase